MLVSEEMYYLVDDDEIPVVARLLSSITVYELVETVSHIIVKGVADAPPYGNLVDVRGGRSYLVMSWPKGGRYEVVIVLGDICGGRGEDDR